jgi:hypothetical protein
MRTIRFVIVVTIATVAASHASAQEQPRAQPSRHSLEIRRFNGLWEAKTQIDGRAVTLYFALHTRDTLLSGNVHRSDRPDPEDIQAAIVTGNELTFTTGSSAAALTYVATFANADAKDLSFTISGARPGAQVVFVATRRTAATER